MYANTNRGNTNTGVIIRKTRNHYLIQTGSDCIEGTLSTRLKNEADFDCVAVGDVVTWNDAAQITEVLPRRNWLSRRGAVPMPGGYAQEQVLIANVDQIVPVFAAANPRPAWNLLDRFLVSAESSEIPALICLTKMDLVEGDQLAEIEAIASEYAAIGYDVVLTSTATGRGLDDLKSRLQGRLSALVGKSGVGKTSLLNAVEPGLGLRVQSTSKATGKGRHTTTMSEIFTLASGGAIADTPGIREFGLWDVAEDDLAWFFPEMRPFLGHCKFNLGCRHDEEPGCAIRKAVVEGQISPYRYQSYLKLRDEA
ncbi:MAG TPA: ribosome small subunit-dependent GTPase A [Aggregatilinea sp.]|uniref:ribosome small subunit-dependent GTPase A n=1 Tax=Aggregatilinea sp. TaxID=2806333 RepID=UPI002B82E487|nr:ribosome small subunit-dependent GTPase A [Aggregatilinea sp.]HML20323.1 ribosome small subunit-dependent GTPase A [Aggregatilinea sp.]